ncbi:MAG: tetratricopeptide repeat protein [Caldilineaceae bacterium]|nr:tetratricopeptide repeat protein [Caldilineaceae bacterium]
MDHQLVPEFILCQAAQERYAGAFPAVCLFVDLAGFTPFTTSLMHHGAEGAEVIADVLRALFEPLIEIVYAQGGFIAAFAGDAFKAIFPTTTPAVYQQALSAAWQIHQTMQRQPTQTTRFGDFHFTLKISVVDGLVTWGIWQATPTNGLAMRQQATYFFAGEALDRCLEVDSFAPAGTVVMTAAVHAQLPQALVKVIPSGQYYQLMAVDQSWLVHRPPLPLVPPSSLVPRTEQFFPAALLQSTTVGEFRQVVTVFVNLQRLPTAQETASFQQRLLQLLNQYGGHLGLVGRIGITDTGCTLLLFWGAPTSYENNLQRALHCLCDLRSALPMALRASITQQLVYAGFVGAARREEYTCYGASVNVAARQLAMAQWGEILLDTHAARQAQSDFAITERGWYLLKGLDGARQIFQLGQPHPTVAHSVYPVPMIGRQAALAQLWRAIQPLRQGRFGGVVTVVGDAGMGKSRLVYEFQQQLQQGKATPATTPATTHSQPLTWFSCQTDEILRQPLNPFLTFLRSYFQQSAHQSELTNQTLFDARLDQLLTTIADRPLATELDRTRSFLAALLGLYWEGSLYQQVEPQLRAENTLTALKTFIKAESLRQPLVLYLEDIHWLDAESALFLEKLTHNVDPFPFLLLLTTRSPAGTAMQPAAIYPVLALPATPQTTIHLAALQAQEMGQLATHWLAGPVTPAVIDLLVDRTAGNPFLAEQLLFYAQEQELLSWSAQGWQLRQDATALAAIRATPLPATIHMVLTARLDRLSPLVKEVVQTAAVLGQSFDRRVLAAMLPQHAAVLSPIVTAEQADIWVASDNDPTRYLFRHALLRETAYTMQLRAQQRTLHHRAAQAIAQVYPQDLPLHYAELVYHYHHSEDWEQERRYAQLAGDYAANHYDNEKAITYLSRAWALTAESAWAERYALALKQEAIYNLLGQRQAQAQILEVLHSLATKLQDNRTGQEVRLRQAYYLRVIGDYEAALTVVQQLLAHNRLWQDQVIEAKSYHSWGRILSQQGHTQAALPKLEHALTIARRLGNRQGEGDSLYDIGHIYQARGHYALAVANYAEALIRYQALGHQRGEINCLLMFGVIANEQGNYPAAHQHYRQVIARARAIGWRYAEAYSLTNLGNNNFDIGDYEAAYTCHQQALEICREIGDQEGEAISLDTLGLIWQHLGHAARARTHFEQALTIQRQISDQRSEGFTLTHLGHTLYALGDCQAAKAIFQQAYALRLELQEESHAIDSLAGLARSALGQNQLPQALAYIDQCITWLQTQGTDGLEFPVLAYLIGYQVLRSAAQANLVAREQARALLTEGYALLQSRAAKIQDDLLRQQFLEAVWFNRALIACWQQELSAFENPTALALTVVGSPEQPEYAVWDYRLTNGR